MMRTVAWLAVALLGAGWAQGQERPLADDDEVVFVRDGDLWSVRGDGRGLHAVVRTPSLREMRPAAAPDGTAIAYEIYETGDRPRYTIWLCGADGSRAEAILPYAQTPRWSPDAGRLLFVSDRAKSLDIWMATRSGSEILRLTTGDDPEYAPCWSPRGDRIAFVREVQEGGQKRFVVVIRDGAGTEQEVISWLGRRIGSLAWAPSESLLVSGPGAGQDRTERLYMVDPDGGGTTELTTGPDSELLGAWTYGLPGLVYTERRRDRTRLMMRALGAGGEVVPNTMDGDTEATILPGLTHRAPQIYVRGARSYYLPTPRLEGLDVLLPASELARQLGWTYELAEGAVTLTSGERTARIDVDTGEVTVGEETRTLDPLPEWVAEVPFVPGLATAALFGVRGEYRPETRILRIGD